MKKFNKNYELCLTLYYEYLLLTGEIDTISVEHKIHLETLIAMGPELQKDLYNELISKLDDVYENTDSIGVTDFYCRLGYSQPALNPINLPLSSPIGENKSYVWIEENMFIPEFRLVL